MNAIESLNGRFREAAVRRGHFPTDQAALKVVYMALIDRRNDWANLTSWINGWKAILNILTTHHNHRIATASNQKGHHSYIRTAVAPIIGGLQ